MARKIATADRVDRDALLEFVRPRHKGTLVTTRGDGRPQLSPVTCGVDGEGRIVVSTYPQRAKAANARRDPRVSILIHSEDWNDPYVQVDGTAEVLDMPDAVEPLVEYFRCISGEHPNWDEYRQAMRDQNKSLIRITIERWGPIATGGFPLSSSERGPSVLKVSVIVPTYRPGDGLDGVVASLDAQSMPQAEFESVFVDDGSGDGTLERLQELAATRSNLRVEGIENSGWPSRPRNVGLDLARGEYVLFMDHDDYLYPGALQAAYEYAAAQRADVVSGKEVRTNQLFAYWSVFQRDLPASAPRTPASVGPWTTHKLFRRQFLLEHGIRFPEGRRMLWEDVMFDMEAYAAGARLAVLASEPFYQWVHRPGQNASQTYGHDAEELVDSVGRIFEHADALGVDEEFASWIKTYEFGLRLLTPYVGPRVLRRDEQESARGFELVRRFVEHRVPRAYDARLSPVNRARVDLVRANRPDLVRELAEADDGLRAEPGAVQVRWDDAGALRLAVTATWTQHGEPLVLRRTGDRFERMLPAAVRAAVSPEACDLTAEVAGLDAALAVTHRGDRVGWPLPTSCEVVSTPYPPGGDGAVTLGVRAAAVLDPAVAAFGRALQPGAWVVSFRAGLLGTTTHEPLPYEGPGLLGTCLLGDGAQLAMVRGSRAGKMLLDLGLVQRDVFALVRPRHAEAEVRAGTLRVPVDPVPGSGSRRPVEVRLRPLGRRVSEPVTLSAELRCDGAGSALECRLPKVARGRYRVSVRDAGGGRPHPTPLVLEVGRLRRLSLTQEPVHRRGPVWQG